MLELSLTLKLTLIISSSSMHVDY